jgi:hypothetical protein
MAIVDKSGSLNKLSSLDNPQINIADVNTNGGKIRFVREIVEVEATDDDGSKYRLARVPANIIINNIFISNDAIVGGVDYDLGVYDTPEINGGSVINANLLADALDLSSDGKYTDATSNVDVADSGKKLWELAGFAKEPNKFLDIVLTANTVGTAAGTIALTVEYSID